MAKMIGVDTYIKGKVGARIYQMWKGVQTVKTMFIPANPQTPSQTANRSVLAQIVATFKQIAVQWIRPFWNPFATNKQTGWGNFISVNKLATGSTFDLSKCVTSQGSLEGLRNPTATYNTANGEISLVWDSETFDNGTDDDKVSFLVVNNDTNEILTKSIANASRGAESYTIDIEAGLTATNVSIFITVSDIDPDAGTIANVSNSQYIICSAA